ncbi:hypothetical protein CTAYLR_004805 [Chrysophaeum taylorii]|uniref:BRCT domain-containing protein n=1 Tax=Chrysophaeum taylorii TaxID=2483200 RepID=A0AAD7XRG0_9STRA|nr:hypothetical protein CTAYLR_004805 [Chrysophaeum taylorii]
MVLDLGAETQPVEMMGDEEEDPCPVIARLVRVTTTANVPATLELREGENIVGGDTAWDDEDAPYVSIPHGSIASRHAVVEVRDVEDEPKHALVRALARTVVRCGNGPETVCRKRISEKLGLGGIVRFGCFSYSLEWGAEEEFVAAPTPGSPGDARDDAALSSAMPAHSLARVLECSAHLARGLRTELPTPDSRPRRESPKSSSKRVLDFDDDATCDDDDYDDGFRVYTKIDDAVASREKTGASDAAPAGESSSSSSLRGKNENRIRAAAVSSTDEDDTLEPSPGMMKQARRKALLSDETDDDVSAAADDDEPRGMNATAAASSEKTEDDEAPDKRQPGRKKECSAETSDDETDENASAAAAAKAKARRGKKKVGATAAAAAAAASTASREDEKKSLNVSALHPPRNKGRRASAAASERCTDDQAPVRARPVRKKKRAAATASDETDDQAETRADPAKKKVKTRASSEDTAADDAEQPRKTVAKTRPASEGNEPTSKKKTKARAKSEEQPRKPAALATTGKKRKAATATPETPGRKRHNDVVVLCTGFKMDSKAKARALAAFGAKEAGRARDATHIVTDNKIKRTPKFLAAISVAHHVVTSDWLDASSAAGSALDTTKYTVRDADAERKWQFSLVDTLASTDRVLAGYAVAVAPGARDATKLPPDDELKEVVECSGGVFFKSLPTKPPGPSWSNGLLAIATAALLDHQDAADPKKKNIKSTTSSRRTTAGRFAAPRSVGKRSPADALRSLPPHTLLGIIDPDVLFTALLRKRLDTAADIMPLSTRAALRRSSASTP